VFAIPFASGCGGGGGGGGGAPAADTTPPSIAFTSPAPSASHSYEADPQSLPALLSLSYSDAGGINTSGFNASFLFRNITFNLTSLFNPGAGSASTGSNSSPLYWTIISKYNTSTNAKTGDIAVFGVSSGSTGVLNLLDVDESAGIVIFAATSRNKLLYVNTTTGAVEREISLSSSPSIIRSCPAHNKIYVAYSGSSAISSFSVPAGVAGGALTMPAVPKAIALNRASSKAFVIFENSQTLVTIDCAANTSTTTTLNYLPQRIAVDGLSSNKLYYAGYGADKGIFQLSSGVQSKLFSLTDLPEDFAFDSQTNRFLLVYYGVDNVEIRNAADGTLFGQPAVGHNPFSLRSAAAASRAYVLNKGSDSVTVINTSNSTVASTISLTADPVGMAVDSTNNALYVLQNIWAISAATPGVISASVKDAAGNTGNTSMNITVNPVSSGNPGGPGTP